MVTEIPDEVIEAAARAAYLASPTELRPEGGWEAIPAEWREEWHRDWKRIASSAAPVVAAWAREQALAEAGAVIQSNAQRWNSIGDEVSALSAVIIALEVAALRGKEGEPNDPGVRDKPTP